MPEAAWTSDVEPAPGELRIVQALLSTVDPRSGHDELADSRALVAWLERWELLDPEAVLTIDDAARVIAARDALLALVARRATPEAAARLDELAAGATLRIRFTADGTSALAPDRGGLDGALGRLLWIVAIAQREDRWSRLKLCAEKGCRRVFYDASPNRSRRWCAARCGNRLAARDWRRRKPPVTVHFSPERYRALRASKAPKK